METTSQIEVADQSLTFRSVLINSLAPNGEQLATAAGFAAAAQATVLHFLPDGELADIRPDETVSLEGGSRKFVILDSDRSYRFTLDGIRFDWPRRVVSGGLLRKLGHVPAEKEIYFEHPDHRERRLGNHDLVDLAAPGVEHFVARERVFKLNVQGVILEVLSPTIVVRVALERAGFNPDQGWQIFLKVHGEPKRPVTLMDTIDLRTPGIDKLRLTPKEINNGEALPAPRHDFGLLDVDVAHLNRLGLHWETVIEGNRRWLVIHGYPVPVGYMVRHTLLALEIPPTYPGAQIYGFFAYPPLALASNRPIASTQMRGTIFGREFHGWSRNRGSTAWNPAIDNVATQLTLVDAALAKEVGE